MSLVLNSPLSKTVQLHHIDCGQKRAAELKVSSLMRPWGAPPIKASDVPLAVDGLYAATHKSAEKMTKLEEINERFILKSI